MIAQYLIDWASIASRVDRATAVDAMRLCGQLTSLREKIEKNGVVIVDEDSRLIENLQDTVVLLNSLVEDNCEEGFSDLILALESFQNVYENRQYYVRAPAENGALQGCAAAWNEHVRPISQQGVAGGVVITDNAELALGTLQSETIDSYSGSETERLRRNWSTGQSFGGESEDDFLAYLNAFAATSSGKVLFVDPYWGATGHPTEPGQESSQQERFLHATQLFVRPFLMNPDVERLDFLTKYPREPNDNRECICFCTDRLCDRIHGMAAVRRGDFVLNVEFVEPDEQRPAMFHNRYIVSENYMMSLLNGMDICDRNGEMVDFEVQLFGQSDSGSNLKRGKVTNYRKRELRPEDVDLPEPYVRTIRDRPSVRITVNG